MQHQDLLQRVCGITVAASAELTMFLVLSGVLSQQSERIVSYAAAAVAAILLVGLRFSKVPKKASALRRVSLLIAWAQVWLATLHVLTITVLQSFGSMAPDSAAKVRSILSLGLALCFLGGVTLAGRENTGVRQQSFARQGDDDR